MSNHVVNLGMHIFFRYVLILTLTFFSGPPLLANDFIGEDCSIFVRYFFPTNLSKINFITEKKIVTREESLNFFGLQGRSVDAQKLRSKTSARETKSMAMSTAAQMIVQNHSKYSFQWTIDVDANINLTNYKIAPGFDGGASAGLLLHRFAMKFPNWATRYGIEAKEKNILIMSQKGPSLLSEHFYGPEKFNIGIYNRESGPIGFVHGLSRNEFQISSTSSQLQGQAYHLHEIENVTAILYGSAIIPVHLKNALILKAQKMEHLHQWISSFDQEHLSEESRRFQKNALDLIEYKMGFFKESIEDFLITSISSIVDNEQSIVVTYASIYAKLSKLLSPMYITPRYTFQNFYTDILLKVQFYNNSQQLSLSTKTSNYVISLINGLDPKLPTPQEVMLSTIEIFQDLNSRTVMNKIIPSIKEEAMAELEVDIYEYLIEVIERDHPGSTASLTEAYRASRLRQRNIHGDSKQSNILPFKKRPKI